MRHPDAAERSVGTFSDRVMAAVPHEVAPTPARSLLSAIRARSARDAASATWVAWHLGTVRRWRIPLRVRARSIALVVAVACALGTGSLAAAATLRVAAEPVADLFSGIDEQGQVESHQPAGVEQQGDANDGGADEPQGGHGDGQQVTGVKKDPDETRSGQPGQGDSGGVQSGGDGDQSGGQNSGPDETDSGNHGANQSGADEPADAGDGTSGQAGEDTPSTGGQSDGSGSGPANAGNAGGDQPGAGDDGSDGASGN